MKNFAVIENELVVNVIIADSLAIAQQVTDGKTCVEFTDEPAEVNGTYKNGRFIKRKPFPSWISDGNDGWIPPFLPPNNPNPNIGYVWDEELTDWVERP